MCSTDIITLDVGGKIFKTSVETLMPSIYLMTFIEAAFTEGRDEGEDEMKPIFIDRDGFLFRYVLLYLRTGRLNVGCIHLNDLKEEAEFYLLNGLQDKIDSLLKAIDEEKKVNVPPPVEYQLISSLELQALSHMTIDGSLTQPDYRTKAHDKSLVTKGYEYITSITYSKQSYNCPRGIFVHTNKDRCGYKCAKATTTSLDECYAYEDETMFLVAYQKPTALNAHAN